jgi:hypothetical protein
MFRSWRCPDKILVFESDDWGSIRTSSSQAYHALISKGYNMKRTHWQLDSLETDDDLSALYNVLLNYKDLRGRPACFTGNIVMANPDFDGIRCSGFRDYLIEDVATTLRSSANRQGVSMLWQEGMENRIFRPQLHAREHIRWWEWMAALNSGSHEALETFDLNMCGVQAQVSKEGHGFFEAPYVNSNLIESGIIDIDKVIKDSVQLFEAQFGFRSLSTIAPFCAWTDRVEATWNDLGIRYIQGYYCQQIIEGDGVKYIPHYLGEVSQRGGLYLVKNCNFEPVSNQKDNIWKNTLRQINTAFKLGIPAVVATHRVNYVGSIEEANRKRGLKQLKLLLDAIKSNWPDVYFLSSAELGYMIENGFRHVNDLDGHEEYVYPVINSMSS